MNSLRRDLIQRRLWPVIIVLVAAIGSVPFLLSRQRPATATLAAAPAFAAKGAATDVSGVATSTTASASAGRAVSASDRDPFGSASTSATKPATTHKVSSAASGAGSTTSTPATTATSSAPSGSSATAFGSAATSTTATTSTTSTTSSTGAGASSATGRTIASAISGQASGEDHTYSLWTVDLRLITRQGATTLTDVPRDTPLPAAGWPKVMFMGMLVHQAGAVFALGGGVAASGVGSCRPSHADCELVVVPQGRSETFRYALANGSERSFTVAVTRIVVRTTHSTAVAHAAYARHSAAGMCELQLGEPIRYGFSTASGRLQAPETACTKTTPKIPFPEDPNRSDR